MNTSSTGGFFAGESRMFPIQSLNAGGGHGGVSDEYNGLRPGDIPAWSARYEYFIGREVLAPDGNYYRCLASHTATQSFAADLLSGLWILFAGSGIGDLITGFTYNPVTGDLVLTADTSGIHTVNIKNIYDQDGVIGTARVATLTDTLTFTGGFGNVLALDGATGIVTIPGLIQDPIGIYFTSSVANPVVGSTLWANSTDADRPYWDNTNKIAFISDIPGAATTIYTGDGVIGTTRVATITDTLEFTGGKIIISDGTEGIAGYIWTSIDINGTGSWIPSPTASTNIYNSDGTVGAGRVATLTNTLAFIGGNIGIGTAAIAATRLAVQGTGNTIATVCQQWLSSTPSILMTLNDDGQLGINTVDWVSGVGGVIDKFAVRGSNGDTGYHTLGLFENTLTPTVNNANNNRTLTVSALKFGAFNTFEVLGVYGSVDNLGAGAITEFNGYRSFINQRGPGAITYGNGYYSDKQHSDGTTTYFSSFTADCTNFTGGTATHIVGLYVKTPVNTGGGTKTNSYGVLIEENTMATNNYGIYQSGTQLNAFNGKMTIGALALSAGASQLEVSGDIEVIGNVDGLVLEDRTLGTRHRVYFDNGSLFFEAA